MVNSSFNTHPSSDQPSVLIVEDDAILALHLRNMLVGLGYRVPQPVASGEDAIAAVAAEPPDLVLLDVQLAGIMDGITAAGHIRSTADIPIIFLTGYSQDPLFKRAKLTAPYGYLIKPVPQRELAATIELALYRHSLDRQLKEQEEALKLAHGELERRVVERTADLLSANEKLNREIDDRERREEILKVSLLLSEFAGAHSLDDLLKKALEEIERLTGSRIGYFHFLEEDQRMLSKQTWSKATLKTFCTSEGKGRHSDVDEAGVWVDCIRLRRPVIHNHYDGLPGRKGLPPGHAAITRELIVPILRGDRIVAILGVGNKDSDYENRDIETVSNLANMTWDVVLRKQAEEQMYDSLTTLNLVIDGISDPIIMLDGERRVKKLNKAARDYYGLSSYGEAVGKPCYEAFQGKSGPCEDCERPISTLENFTGCYERKGVMNFERIEQVFVDLARDQSGAPMATIIRIYDITQARMRDRQIIQSEKLSSLGLLIAGIAHEINNPNNFIYFNTPILRSYLQFLLPIVDEYVSAHPDLMVFGRPYPVFREDCFKLLDNIQHGSTRINQIVGNLREFVRERGQGDRRRINLKQVVEKAISICSGRIRKIVKRFDVTIPENIPALLTDPLALEQVVVNLLINAAQAADKDDSWVSLTIAGPNQPDGEVILEVRDNGCGMDDPTQRKIFDPFFTTKPVGVGTGLGLSITHRLVEELGGRIEVWSEVGKGSKFQVIFRIASSSQDDEGR
jgi:signal transduction histidine kinase/CheY-like chemotaxis protein